MGLIGFFPRQNEEYHSAREVFEEAHTERMDWPEAIWEAWLSFEHIHGSVQTINDCMDSIEKASARTKAFRAKVSTLLPAL